MTSIGNVSKQSQPNLSREKGALSKADKKAMGAAKPLLIGGKIAREALYLSELGFSMPKSYGVKQLSQKDIEEMKALLEKSKREQQERLKRAKEALENPNP